MIYTTEEITKEHILQCAYDMAMQTVKLVGMFCQAFLLTWGIGTVVTTKAKHWDFATKLILANEGRKFIRKQFQHKRSK